MKKYLTFIILFFCLGVTENSHGQDQSGEATELVIRNIDERPLENAKVWFEEGAKFKMSDKTGMVKLNLKNAGEKIRIEADGYISTVFAVDSLISLKEKSIQLILPVFEMNKKVAKTVQLPFGSLPKRRIVGSVSSLVSDEVLEFDNNQSVMGALVGRIPGMFGSRNIRGLGDAVVIVDGIPRSTNTGSGRLNIMDNFNLSQIEEITVLKDAVSKMLYGVKADNGAILITTKRGVPYKKELKVYAESGVNVPISYPDFLSASDYMTLYNEALANDGINIPKFSSDEIQNSFNKTNPIRYPDESFYGNDYLRDQTSYIDLTTNASGGNELVQYFTSLSFKRDGSIYKVKDNNGKKASVEHINFRGNVNFKINNFMTAHLDGGAFYHFNRYPNGYYDDDYDGTLFSFAARQLPNSFPTLIPVDLVRDSAILKSAKLIDGKYLLGGTNQFGNNLLGNLVLGGMQSTQQKSIQFNAGVHLDLSSIIEGLSANVDFTYDFLNSYTLRQENKYAVYEPSYMVGSDGKDSLVVTQYGTDEKRDDQTVNGNYFQRRYGAFSTLNYHKKINDNHVLDMTGLVYMSTYSTGRSAASNFGIVKDQHFGLRANYMLRNKYLTELDAVYVGSSFLPKNKRYDISSSIGLGWILSEENFLKDNSVIDYLKIKTTYGLVNTDASFDTYRLYETSYAPGGNFAYNNSSGNKNSVTNISTTGNPNLGFVKQKEVNLGFESSLFSEKAWIDASYFNHKIEDIPVIRSNAFPSYLGGFIPMVNYNANRISGIDIGIQYKNDLKKLKYSVGLNMIYAIPRSLKVDQAPQEFDYLVREGKVGDAMFGFVAEGLFKDSAEIMSHAKQTFGTVRPGDIKYKDLNDDGIIDNNDRMQIGNSSSRFQYGININLKYGRFQLFLLGVARTGGYTYYSNSYYWIFGERKYSEVVINRWTPAAAETATYPRLTTTDGANNFRNSTYWLYKNDYLKLRTAQLTYYIPGGAFFRGLQLYLRGDNLATFSSTRKQQELNVDSSPQMRGFKVGLTGSF